MSKGSCFARNRASLIAVLISFSPATTAAAPCTLCTRGAISEPEKVIEIPGYEIINTCGTLDSFLPIVLTDENAPECELLRAISTFCGCPPPEDSCSFCPDGSAVSEPQKEVSFLKELFIGIPPTCELVEAYFAGISGKSSLCNTGQLISSYCGCAPLENHCQFCGGEPLTDEFRDVPLLQLLDDSYGNTNLGITPTCETLYAVQYQLRDDDEICRTSRFETFHCGCNDGVFEYFGAKTTKQQAILAWVPRSVGLLSLMASLLVFCDIFRDKKKRHSVYHQLVVVVTMFDCITSLVWIVGTAAVPEIEFELTSGVYGAKGNDATCTAQGFFVQLGFTSVYMNVSLTVYYLLVIVYSFREQRLRRLRLWMFGIPLTIGFAMAFAVIPFVYHNTAICDVAPYGTMDENLWQLLVFAVVPVLTATLVIIVILLFIYLKVRQTRTTKRKWSSATSNVKENVPKEAGSKTSLVTSARQLLPSAPSIRRRKATRDKLQREVFWQCFSYAAVFGITWPLWAVGKVHASQYDLPIGFWIVFFVVAPLQGFNNAICYFRPFRRRSQRLRRQQSSSKVKPRYFQKWKDAVSKGLSKTEASNVSCLRTNSMVAHSKPKGDESRDGRPSKSRTIQQGSSSTIGSVDPVVRLSNMPVELETDYTHIVENNKEKTEIPLGDDYHPEPGEVISFQEGENSHQMNSGAGAADVQVSRKSFFRRVSDVVFGLNDDYETASENFTVDPVVALAQMLEEVNREELHERRNPEADQVKKSFMRRASNVAFGLNRRQLSGVDPAVIKDSKIPEQGSKEDEMFDSLEPEAKCRSAMF